MSDKLTIGSTVWYREENSRHYERGRDGPTERGHWREVRIVGESAQKWILSGHAGKLPKNGRVPYGYATSLAGIERAIWFAENYHRIGAAVQRLGWGVVADFDAAYVKLAAVASAIGYEPMSPDSGGPKKESHA